MMTIVTAVNLVSKEAIALFILGKTICSGWLV